MKKTLPLSRRTALKGMGAAISLPLLEAMLPARTLAAPAPLRLAFLYVPNGKHMADWTPKEEGSGYTLPAILEPLQGVKDELVVLTGLALDKARPHGDGPGDHARAMASFLTARQAKKTHGADIRAGVSVDQLLAQKVGSATRFPSLELGCDRGPNAGNCDSGYSCAYSTNLSWRTESTPTSKEIDPRQVFERLFTTSDPRADPNLARRDLYKRSILDFVAEDTTRLRARLGVTDQRKVDEYLTAIREIEQRLSKAPPAVEVGQTRMVKPAGIPKDYKEHLRLMTDLLVLAFRGDLTRIATFVYANDGSNRSYSFLGVPEGHHDLSHHGRDKAKQEKIKKINLFHVSQFAYLLEKLKSIPEGEGTLLDHCLIVYGSGISDGDAHNHDNLPVLLAGKGRGTVRTGRHVRFRKETPLANLYVSLLDRAGVKMEAFGDSTGPLTGLEE